MGPFIGGFLKEVESGDLLPRGGGSGGGGGDSDVELSGGGGGGGGFDESIKKKQVKMCGNLQTEATSKTKDT